MISSWRKEDLHGEITLIEVTRQRIFKAFFDRTELRIESVGIYSCRPHTYTHVLYKYITFIYCMTKLSKDNEKKKTTS